MRTSTGKRIRELPTGNRKVSKAKTDTAVLAAAQAELESDVESGEEVNALVGGSRVRTVRLRLGSEVISLPLSAPSVASASFVSTPVSFVPAPTSFVPVPASFVPAPAATASVAFARPASVGPASVGQGQGPGTQAVVREDAQRAPDGLGQWEQPEWAQPERQWTPGGLGQLEQPEWAQPGGQWASEGQGQQWASEGQEQWAPPGNQWAPEGQEQWAPEGQGLWAQPSNQWASKGQEQWAPKGQGQWAQQPQQLGHQQLWEHQQKQQQWGHQQEQWGVQQWQQQQWQQQLQLEQQQQQWQQQMQLEQQQWQQQMQLEQQQLQQQQKQQQKQQQQWAPFSVSAALCSVPPSAQRMVASQKASQIEVMPGLQPLTAAAAAFAAQGSGELPEPMHPKYGNNLTALKAPDVVTPVPPPYFTAEATDATIVAGALAGVQEGD
ncbi:hypothetical protein T492DRAFT_872853 [Pavlovales sp. CCMP2436]|nr:hypothetical protein T492DRAFT_872853 [Pavlovales sp. CCMP2436]